MAFHRLKSSSLSDIGNIMDSYGKKLSGVGWCMVKVTGIVGKWLGYELD